MVARVTGTITLNGVQYPIENFTITWDNDLQPSYLNGSTMIDFTSPYFETEEQRDKRLNPRKYDSCKFCDHHRYRHESNYGKCNGQQWDYEESEPTECECKEFI